MGPVLVTGGMGLIGSWVTRKLIQQGRRVVTYQRHMDATLLNDIIDKVNYVEGDVLDLPNLIRTIRHYGVERVIHMATVFGNPLETNPFLGYRINVDGALNVFEASRLMDVKRVVFTSSKAVYDLVRGEYAHPTSKPIDEDYPKAPLTVYGATKLFAENMGLVYNRIYGLDVIALRFASTYGPRKAAQPGPASIRGRIIESAMLGKPLKIPGGEDQLDDVVYNKDLADGIVLACFAENLEHRVFHLGTGNGETIQHLIEILEKIFGKVTIEIDPELEKISWWLNSCIYNIDRARRELGYSPQYNLEKGVRDYIETMKRLDIPPAALP